MLYRFYVYNEQVLLPTVAETEEGFYVDTKPVEMFPAVEVDEWKTHLYKRLTSRNEIIPTPQASDSGHSVLLDALHIEKWSVFEKRAIMYTVHAVGRYLRVFRTGKGPDGMWEAANTSERIFDSRAPWSFITDALAEDALSQPEAHPVKVGGLMVIRKS